MGLTLGVDPTATGTGAAVLRVDGAVVAWWAWTRVRGGWRLRCSRSTDPPPVLPSLEAVGAFVAAGSPSGAGVIVEGLHAPARWQRRASGADMIALAEATGRTIAGLTSSLGEPVARPLWVEWTAPLGLLGLTGDAATGCLLAEARREGWLPAWTLAEQCALADASGIGRYVRA